MFVDLPDPISFGSGESGADTLEEAVAGFHKNTTRASDVNVLNGLCNIGMLCNQSVNLLEIVWRETVSVRPDNFYRAGRQREGKQRHESAHRSNGNKLSRGYRERGCKFLELF
jgi:hypothetical protein